MLEQFLIEHCSPTLASLKTANLFCYSYQKEDSLKEQVRLWNCQLAEKGVSVVILKERAEKALIYVYRPNKLQEDLDRRDTADFLTQYGYEAGFSLEQVLLHLQERFKNSDCFPHEIGLFLGYPLGDVVGFIENDGRNSKCSGCWKVYCNECEAIRMFRKFKKCQTVYKKLFQQGRSVLQLTVAV